MEKLSNIFKNKKVLVTGHTGFKGSWLSFWLKELGSHVCGISKNVPTKPSMYEILNIKKNIVDKKFDIRNLKILKNVVKKFKPDYIFHLAAQSLVKKSYKDPIETFTTNAIGTCNLLESIRYLNNKCNVILVTSDKSYKNKEILRGYREGDELGGYDPYSASKGCAEFIIQSYIKSFLTNKKNIKIAVARAGNVIGGGDWSKNRVIPDCFNSWVRNKPMVLRSPNATRPWQHVLEVLSGYLVLSINLNKKPALNGEVFNFGPKKNQNKTVIEVVKQIKKNIPNITWQFGKKKFFYESKLLKLNSFKAKKKLNWKNKLSFFETIEMTSEWYKMFYNKSNMIKFTSNQILKYEKKL